ncbi:MAG: pyrroline-5-carboxylate reductase [Candidatus Margulisiibacteriota bacterium]
MTKIAFVGSGKMAEALIAKLAKSNQIMAADIDAKRLNYLKKKYKIKITKENSEAFRFGEVVIFAVKPQNMSEAIGEIGGIGGKKLESSSTTLGASRNSRLENWKGKLVISIAAGVSLGFLQRRLPGMAIIRTMPNNPCFIGQGITAIAKGNKATAKNVKQAKAIFESVGQVFDVPEKLMDAVTGLSGSGPAFVYQTIEALALGGVDAGLPKQLAERFALQTVIGAALTVKNTGKSPTELTVMVASPGGTTIEGLKMLEKYELPKAFKEAVAAAARKSANLSKKLEN